MSRHRKVRGMGGRGTKPLMQDNELVGEWLSLQWLAPTAQEVLHEFFCFTDFKFNAFPSQSSRQTCSGWT